MSLSTRSAFRPAPRPRRRTTRSLPATPSPETRAALAGWSADDNMLTPGPVPGISSAEMSPVLPSPRPAAQAAPDSPANLLYDPSSASPAAAVAAGLLLADPFKPSGQETASTAPMAPAQIPIVQASVAGTTVPSILASAPQLELPPDPGLRRETPDLDYKHTEDRPFMRRRWNRWTLPETGVRRVLRRRG
jgi:hypothetical protein